MTRRPNWHLQLDRNTTIPGQDGFTFHFNLRVGDTNAQVTAQCSKTILATFLADHDWPEEVAAIALCAYAIAEQKGPTPPIETVDALNPEAISREDAEALADGQMINLDKPLQPIFG